MGSKSVILLPTGECFRMNSPFHDGLQNESISDSRVPPGREDEVGGGGNKGWKMEGEQIFLLCVEWIFLTFHF